MEKRQRLSDRAIRKLEPRGTAYKVPDNEVAGLAIRVYPSGARSFWFDYTLRGRRRRMTIGSFPAWSTTAARERALELRRRVEAGDDPLAEKDADRAAPRVPDLIDRYEREHLPRLAARNAADQKSMLRKLVEPEWKARRVDEITPADVERLLGKIAEGRARPAKPNAKTRRKRALAPPKPTPIRANRVGEVLRKMFGLAVEWKMRADNPASSFHRRLETERERFLSKQEIKRLADALDAAEDQRAASIVRMCMLTGARLGEVRTARFEHFDLHLMIWTKPAANTKQRRVHRVVISEDVADLIRRRRAAVPAGCPWVFPGDVTDGAGMPTQPVTEIRRFWRSIQTDADLPGVRIHDLRHTFASLLASGGLSLEMIGKLLGHTQARTTMRYAHLVDTPLREGVASVAAAFRERPRVVGGRDHEA